MRRSYSGFGLFIIGLLVVSAFANAQSDTPSLSVDIPQLYFASPTALANGTAPDTVAPDCGPQLSAAPVPTGTFVWDLLPTNGSYHPTAQLPVITLAFDGAGAQPYRSLGFRADVQLKGGATVFGTGTTNVAAGAQAESRDVTLAAAGNATPVANASSKITVVVTLTSTGQTGNLPGQTQSVQVQCPTSTVATFKIFRGPPGDGDFDSDRIPDSEDQDVDGDGASNQAEAGKQCVQNGAQVDFARNPAPTDSPNDHDGDGYTDDEECSAGSDPLNALAVPPPPASLPWGLIIGGFLLLLVIAALVFFFTVFGKAAALQVVSATELVVPAGTQGKFQLQLQNLRKKGNPINFQLSAQGMPDGWDAKLQPDHAVLDPVGGAKNVEAVWLHVESPQHTDAESAVVKVKAIALNSAGRKDTLKLPASARTITSINVPPNAKVPVKRGEPVKIKSEKELAKEAAAGAPAPEGEPASMPVTAAAAAPEETKGKKAKKGKAAEPAPEPVPTPAPAPAAPTTKPALQVGGLAHSPTSFASGQDVRSVVTVTNNGQGPQTLKLSLFVNDALADAQTVSVKPGKSKEVKFKWTAQERNKLNIRGELVTG